MWRVWVEEVNEQGEELKNWCEEKGLYWVNGFYSDRRRGDVVVRFYEKVVWAGWVCDEAGVEA